jgi:hypothetical protein
MESLDILIPRQNPVCSPACPIELRTIEHCRSGAGKAKLACRVISISVFIAWIALMVTVVAEGGSALTIVGVTLLPMASHIVTVTLTAIGLTPETDLTL